MRRLEHGFCGYWVPVVPRASRSARGRGPIRKKCEEDQIRAFEILARVAGTVLQESENSVSTNAACVKNMPRIRNANSKRDIECEGRSLKKDPCGQGNCDEKSFACVPGLQGHHESYTLNEFSHVQDNQVLEVGSASNTYDKSEMICFTKKLATVSIKNNCGSSSSRVVGHSLSFGEFSEENVGMLARKLEAEPHKSISEKNGILPVSDSSEDPMELDRRSLALVGSECDVKVSLLRDHLNVGTLPRRYDNVEVVSRDDDENSVGCIQPSTLSKSYRPPPDSGERRIKKLFASRQWRESQKFKDGKMKQMCCNKRYSHMDDRSQNIYPFKKRKFFSQSPLCTSDEVFHQEGMTDFPDKRNGDNQSAGATTSTGASSSVTGQVPPASKGCNVKLSIKSFKVPELVIEIPATATVGSLKRTVMEAVTAVLGDGLHVGILLQGKKVRDDSKTLLQTGISQDQKHHSLGFILEPRHAQINPPASSEDSSLLSGGTGTPQGLSSCGESKLNIVPSLADISTGNTMPETQALVAVPAIGMEALAVIPFHQRSHSEFARRRIRRPFSVTEVEALVQAVEKLGTGRWRDVKLRAFDSVKHRTYVDLKDKWKTLVHTARISPQQRRGEPVPQELLERVLAAHAYWSQHQTRQQVNNNVKD